MINQGLRKGAYKRSKYSSSLAIIDNKPKAAFEILEHLIRRVRAPISKGSICFDHKHCFVGSSR